MVAVVNWYTDSGQRFGQYVAYRRKRKNLDPPSSARQFFGEQYKLALCAAKV
ncbi:hypothetical protein MesoLj131a_20560 [Mesorhizobium sp. 131-2-1]|nr:hypothetical protein MesoLj131a_20560 [Mesorhizobium sp. 131-2-1]